MKKKKNLNYINQRQIIPLSIHLVVDLCLCASFVIHSIHKKYKTNDNFILSFYCSSFSISTSYQALSIQFFSLLKRSGCKKRRSQNVLFCSEFDAFLATKFKAIEAKFQRFLIYKHCVST